MLDALRNGCSRHDAASLAGVVYRTLAYECERDDEFRAACEAAEIKGKAACIKKVMAKKPEFILERKYWREYARRNPEALSLQVVLSVVTRLFSRVLVRVPSEHHAGIADDLQAALDELRLAAGGGGAADV